MHIEDVQNKIDNNKIIKIKSRSLTNKSKDGDDVYTNLRSIRLHLTALIKSFTRVETREKQIAFDKLKDSFSIQKLKSQINNLEQKIANKYQQQFYFNSKLQIFDNILRKIDLNSKQRFRCCLSFYFERWRVIVFERYHCISKAVLLLNSTTYKNKNIVWCFKQLLRNNEHEILWSQSQLDKEKVESMFTKRQYYNKLKLNSQNERLFKVIYTVKCFNYWKEYSIRNKALKMHNKLCIQSLNYYNLNLMRRVFDCLKQTLIDSKTEKCKQDLK